MKVLNEKESRRDAPHGKPPAAQDVASLPALGGHVAQGKRSLPIPNKVSWGAGGWGLGGEGAALCM